MNDNHRGLGLERGRGPSMGPSLTGRGRNRGYGYRYLNDVSLQDLPYYDVISDKKPLRLRDGSCRFCEFDRDDFGRNYYCQRDIVSQIGKAIRGRNEKKGKR
jgi:hypothetical protein